MSSSRGRTLLVVVILLLAVLLAAGNIFCHALVVQELTGVPPEPAGDRLQQVMHSIGQSLAQRPEFVWFFSGAPLLVGLVLALLVGLRREKAAPAAAAAGAPGADAATEGALRLLGMLQKEGRLVDFLEEDIEPYSDAQVGAAVRAIHAGCRKALHERMQIARIFAEEDGASVEIPAGFAAAEVRLTGNVHGQPPFRGVLQHGGWRAESVDLPRGTGLDPAVLAPAEVEIA